MAAPGYRQPALVAAVTVERPGAIDNRRRLGRAAIFEKKRDVIVGRFRVFGIEVDARTVEIFRSLKILPHVPQELSQLAVVIRIGWLEFDDLAIERFGGSVVLACMVKENGRPEVDMHIVWGKLERALKEVLRLVIVFPVMFQIRECAVDPGVVGFEFESPPKQTFGLAGIPSGPSQKTRQVADCFGVVGSNFKGSSVEPFGLVVVLPTVAHVNG